MAAAFSFSYDKSSTTGSSGANGGGSGGGVSSDSATLKCDLCGEQPGSLSELRTLPCLHTLCKKCFRFRQIGGATTECPICGCRVSGVGLGPGGVAPIKTSAATVMSSFGGGTTSGQSHSSQLLLHDAYNVEQLTVDTSFLIGNLLETVSLDDTIVPSQAQIIGSTNVRSYSTSSSSSKQQPQHIVGGLHRSAAITAAVAAPSSSSHYDHQQQQQQQQQQQKQSLKLYAYAQQQQQQQQQQKSRSALSTQNPQMQPIFQQQQQQQQQRLYYCSCAEGVEATSRCDDCDEVLCVNCVQAHMRVRLTKDHRIYRLSNIASGVAAAVPTCVAVAATGPQQQQMSYSLRALSGVLSSSSSFGSFPTAATTTTTGILPPSTSSTSSTTTSSLLLLNNYCNVHRDEPLNLHCDTCTQPLCRSCALSAEHAGHQVQYAASADFGGSGGTMLTRGGGGGGGGGGSSAQRNIVGAQLPTLVGELRQFVKNVEDTADVVERMTERVETRVMSVSNEIRAVVHHHISALEERKRDLLQRVDAVRAAKVNALCAQRDELRSHQAKLRASLDQVDALLASGAESDIAKARETLYEQITYAKNVRPFLQQHEDDRVVFIGPEPPLLTALRNLGSIVTGAFAPNSIIVGDIYRRAIKDKAVVYTVQAKDHVGESCTVGGDQVNVVVQTPDGYHFNGDVNDKKNGTYLCSFKPTMEGKHLIYIFIRAKPIHGSPFSLLVRKGRDYASLGGHPIFSFGIEGTEDGQLCRPWGITCDKQNRIIIADRSNNRVQIFDQNGKFLHKFGSPGCRNGQFDRPAGVAVNSKNQIIVVDKDNHRVQVFNSEGQFLFKFGEKGRSPGQFNYPWDCAVSSDDSIAVSDTRNHRVQLFNASGAFLKKFGFESSLLFKQFDSPRGLVFAPDGRLLVTDFNNHRLVIIDLVHDQLDFVGREGEYEGCFRRPQGIDVDLDGAILVADSRNNRIQAFSPQMQFVGSFGVDTGPGRTRALMDRPCDLCVSPDGRIFVVDFGNNKIHVF